MFTVVNDHVLGDFYPSGMEFGGSVGGVAQKKDLGGGEGVEEWREGAFGREGGQ
jgi:hypothetical protein